MLENAIQKLRKTGASVVFADAGGRYHICEGRGVQPLLDCIAAGERYPGGAMADRLVGKAAAALAVLLGVASVHGEVMSEAGRDYLAARGIAFSFREMIPRVLNRTGDDTCPMEKSVQHLDDPAECLQALIRTQAALRAGAPRP